MQDMVNYVRSKKKRFWEDKQVMPTCYICTNSIVKTAYTDNMIILILADLLVSRYYLSVSLLKQILLQEHVKASFGIVSLYKLVPGQF